MSHKWLNKDRCCGLVALTLFILTIPLSNWVVVNVGLVCEPNGPCLIPVWPGLLAPSAVMIAGAALVLRNAVQAFLGAPFLFAQLLSAPPCQRFLPSPLWCSLPLPLFVFRN